MKPFTLIVSLALLVAPATTSAQYTPMPNTYTHYHQYQPPANKPQGRTSQAAKARYASCTRQARVKYKQGSKARVRAYKACEAQRVAMTRKRR